MAFLQPGDDAVYAQHAFAVYPLATQARGAHRHRGAGARLRPRPAGDARGDHAADARRVRRQSEQSDRHVDRAGGARGVRRVGAARRRSSCSTRRTTSTSSPRDRADSVALDRDAIPNLVVSRTFSKAYGLAALRVGYGVMNADGRRHAEPRAPAVQRQRARAGRGGRGARRHRRTSTRAARSIAQGMRAARRGPRGARPALRAVARQLRAREGRRCARASTRRCCSKGVIVRPVANYGLPEWLRVTVGLPAENERFLDALAQGARAADSRVRQPHRQARRRRRRPHRRLVRAGAASAAGAVGEVVGVGRTPREPRRRRSSAASSTAR